MNSYIEIETIEVAGFGAAVKTLRLPYGLQVRSKVYPHKAAIMHDDIITWFPYTHVHLDERDLTLMQSLIRKGDEHAKFNNEGRMIFNCFDWVRDNTTPKVHPTQKPVRLLEQLIRIFTDEGDVIIDPCAGSGSSLLAAMQTGRKAYGFEIKKEFFKASKEKVLSHYQTSLF